MSADSRRTTGIVLASATLAIAVTGLAICNSQHSDPATTNSATSAQPTLPNLAMSERPDSNSDNVSRMNLRNAPKTDGIVNGFGYDNTWIRFGLNVVRFVINNRDSIFDSEVLRHAPEIWERLWGMEMPDVATPYRVHGPVI